MYYLHAICIFATWADKPENVVTSAVSYIPATFIIASMAQTGLSLVLAIIVLALHHHSPDTPVPACVRSLVFGCMAKMLCFRDPGNTRLSPKVAPEKRGLPPNAVTVQDLEKTVPVPQQPGLQLPDDIARYIRKLMEKEEETEFVESNKSDWERVGHIVDRFLLIFFLLLTTVEIVFFIVVTYYGYAW